MKSKHKHTGVLFDMPIIKRPTNKPTKIPYEIKIDAELHNALTQYRVVISKWISAKQDEGIELEETIDPEVEKRLKSVFIKDALEFKDETAGDANAVFPDELQAYLVTNKPVKKKTAAEKKDEELQKKIQAIQSDIRKLENDKYSANETTKKEKIEKKLETKHKALQREESKLSPKG